MQLMSYSALAVWMLIALVKSSQGSQLVKRSDGERHDRSLPRENLSNAEGQAGQDPTWQQGSTRQRRYLEESHRQMIQSRRNYEEARRQAFSRLLHPGETPLGRQIRLRQADRQHEQDYRASRTRRLRHTGVPVDIIPAYFEPFLIDGDFPQEEPIDVNDRETPSTFAERYRREHDNELMHYYFYEHQYAERLMEIDIPMDAWQRLLANRSPRALRIRRDFMKRASWVMRTVRKVLIANGYSASNTEIFEEEYAYARLMLDLFYDEREVSRQEYILRLRRQDPHATEARAMFEQVHSQAWPITEDESDDEDDDEPI